MGYLEAKKYPIKNGISMVKALIYEFKKQTNNLAKNKVFPLVGKVSNTLLSFAKYKSFVTLDNISPYVLLSKYFNGILFIFFDILVLKPFATLLVITTSKYASM